MQITYLSITTLSPLLVQVVDLWKAYQIELNENLCFQSFDEELANPLKKYSPPTGALWIAVHDSMVIGCVALQALADGSCEMKRLYVIPNYRKYKIGEQLVQYIITEAKLLGYTTMKLDTLQKLQPAIKLYEKFGFVHTTAYYTNPLANVVYMQKELG